MTIKHLKPHELTKFAVAFMESLVNLDPFQKQEVIAVANILVEIEVRRYMQRDLDARTNPPTK